MITLTKLCQLTGLTRRVLQDYDRIGLLRRHSQTPGGYWMYEESALERLQMIQLLRSHGCSRQEVLEALGTQNDSAQELLEKGIAALQKKRELIEHDLRLLQTHAQRHAGTADTPEGEADHSAM